MAPALGIEGNLRLESNRLIAVARGDSLADLVLSNARVVNIFTGQVETGNVAICDGRIAGIGDYHQAREVLDLGGRYVAPGLINGHTHLESSLLDVPQYASAVVPQGTLAIVTDLHEIANICGLKGIKYIINSARRLPMSLFLMAPSCVPATQLETSGASLDAQALRPVFRWQGCLGLGEVMNFPAVLSGDKEMLSKIELARGRVVDGHAPGLSGKNLNAYISAGIHSDHESVSLEEAREKLEKGMFIMIREGSSEKNLEALLPLVNDRTYQRCMLVVDDRSCVDLLQDGDINAVVRKAIALGLEPIRALQLATINPASYFRIPDIGAVAPGYQANLLVLDELAHLTPTMVFYRGCLVAQDGKPCFSTPRTASQGLDHTINIKSLGLEALRLPAITEPKPVIEVVPGQIVTRKIQKKVKVLDGAVIPDTSRDILKLAVVERHHATGNIGVGMVKGFGLKQGALASSIAHDSHNIVVVGTSDENMLMAIKEVERLNGGLVAVSGGKVLASLALPIAGILSKEPLETTVSGLRSLEEIAMELGCKLPSPFSTLSFLALPVIPEIRLTDLGLVDVLEFRIIDK